MVQKKSASKKSTSKKSTTKKAVSKKVSKKATTKKAAVKKKAVTKKKVTTKKKAVAKKKVASKKAAVTAKSTVTYITPEQRYKMVEEAAYHLSEKQGFEPARDVDNWLIAEHQIEAELKKRNIQVK